MNSKLLPKKESVSHGTADFPCAGYRAVYTEYPTPIPYDCKHHWHEELEILFFEQGNYHLELGAEHIEITRPCLCFVRSTEFHAFYCEKDYVESAIVFSPSMLSFFGNDTCQNEYIQPLIDNEIFLPRFLFSDDPYFSSVLFYYRSILQILNPVTTDYANAHRTIHTTPAGQLLIKASLLGIIATLASANLLTTQPVQSDTRIDLIKDSIIYMKTHYAEKIYIGDLAALASMNEQYYCRFFKKMIGKSPIQYLNELRIQHSMRLLRDTNASVMDISLECGFNNLGNYMKFFRSLTGTTPLQYRKSVKSYIPI